MRSRLVTVLVAIAVVAVGFWAIYRLTEPSGRTPSPAEVRAAASDEEQFRDSAISRTAEKERRLKEALRPGDFEGAMQVAHTRRLMLMLKADRDGTDKSEIAADPDLRRILRLCRRWARNDGELRLVDSMARPPEAMPNVQRIGH